ncbi:3-phosphoshikimate 1-carboxyvinyltransferase [Clostridium ganghwense]|uniref:3-phosphoshikimate 1-carboxyvinyltransferase n=1 Tax=Clostridium ganghwense TaxID=312089 RepID=A0ABT4CLR9_9CLOT|nr:3-phosphoshikimate 1-carboxyvinyltransferase [Clostridium ganghwense]MCY6369992.1 3-phosphoshikimate 1-carboxyvinyltransferase [Clostridium ganghwense]
MESVIIYPGVLKGNVKVPPSKSLAHRAVICAGFAEGESNIDNIIFSDDITATSKAMEGLGVEIKVKEENIKEENIKEENIKEEKNTQAEKRVRLNIKGNEQLSLLNNTVDCIESGSTLRFLIPIALLAEGEVTFKGRGKLVSRPLDVYYEIFEKQNIYYETNNGELPLKIKGGLKPGEFRVKGDISSQFITGLMFALPLLDGDSKIIITTELESKGYVDLTIDTLNKFGVKIENKDYKEFYIKGNQKYSNRDYRVEGDFSQVAFWLVAGALGDSLKCEDLNINSLQGDKVIVDILKKMGADISINKNYIEAKSSSTKGIVIDASECPDLVPVLTVMAALSEGTTKIVNAKRLRIKECDRLNAIASELNKIGGDVEELEDGLIIRGKKSLKGGKVDSWNDHRIAMAMAVASIKCEEPLIITNSDAVKKSYPDFWTDFKNLGGKIDEWNLGK